jgi:hypothetical protein
MPMTECIYVVSRRSNLLLFSWCFHTKRIWHARLWWEKMIYVRLRIAISLFAMTLEWPWGGGPVIGMSRSSSCSEVLVVVVEQSCFVLLESGWCGFVRCPCGFCVNCNPPHYLRARNVWFVVVERYLRSLLGCSPYGAVVRCQLIEGTAMRKF